MTIRTNSNTEIQASRLSYRQQRDRAIVIDAVSQQRSVIVSPPVPGQYHPAGANGRCPRDHRDRVGPGALAIVSRSGDLHPQPFPHHPQGRDERIVADIHDFFVIRRRRGSQLGQRRLGQTLLGEVLVFQPANIRREAFFRIFGSPLKNQFMETL